MFKRNTSANNKQINDYEKQTLMLRTIIRSNAKIKDKW